MGAVTGWPRPPLSQRESGARLRFIRGGGGGSRSCVHSTRVDASRRMFYLDGTLISPRGVDQGNTRRLISASPPKYPASWALLVAGVSFVLLEGPVLME